MEGLNKSVDTPSATCPVRHTKWPALSVRAHTQYPTEGYEFTFYFNLLRRLRGFCKIANCANCSANRYSLLERYITDHF